METLKIRLIGETPLMIHNNRLANPLNEYSRELKKLTKKRDKTDADVMEISSTSGARKHCRRILSMGCFAVLFAVQQF